MTQRAIAITVGSIVTLVLFAFLISCTVLFWKNKNKQDTSYNDGYIAGLQDKSAYEIEITKLKNDKESLTAQLDTANNNITQLNAEKATLENKKEELQTQCATLTAKNEANALEITRLTTLVDEYKTQIDSLDKTNTDHLATINSLNSQITLLNEQITTLNNTNTTNANTIATLNTQIESLSTQINTLTSQIATQVDTISSLNAQIAKLNNSITVYEQFLRGLESDTQAVATFVYNGTVYSIQVAPKDTTVSVADPTSTTYIIFNGWTVNGADVTLSNYPLTTNTEFVAKVTYRYNVSFVANDVTTNSQIVTRNEYATVPANPTREGYSFGGWLLNGVVIDPTTYPITGDTTFVARWTQVHTVQYVAEDVVLDTQSVNNCEYSTLYNYTGTAYKIFQCWQVNGVDVDPATYPITQDTIFTAKLLYKYDVQFNVDNAVYGDSQIIARNEYATAPAVPTKNKYVFKGWSVDGTNIVNLSTYKITQDTTFVAVFAELFSVQYMAEDTVLDTQTVECGTYAYCYEEYPDVADKLFVGWSIDGYNVVDCSSYVITQDTTFIGVYGHKWAGVWSGNCTTDSTKTLTIKISDSGVALLTVNINGDRNFENAPIAYMSVTGQEYYLFSISGYVEFKVYEEDDNLRFACTNPRLTFLLSRTTDRMEQTYIVGVDKQYTGTDFSGNAVNYSIKINGYQLFLGGVVSSTYTYFIVGDKIYYYTGGWNNYGVVADFVLTDTSLTIGEDVYTFI